MILTHPNPILNTVSTEVETLPDGLVQSLITNMYEHKGKGLSAIQIGVPLRVFVVDIDSNPVVMVNPYILHLEDTQMYKEGCLSFPGLWAPVERYNICTVQYHTPEGTPAHRQCNGFDAQAVQHEYDHLQGLTMVSKMGPLTRRLFLKGKL